jgi:uncharacterized membrane protein YoaK (UPF0700 family)
MAAAAISIVRSAQRRRVAGACFLALLHVFVANMTGNTIDAGVGLVDGNWSLALRRGFAIPMFVLGMFLSRFWMRAAQRWNFTSIAASVAYGCEAVLLVAFVWIGSGHVAHGKILTDSAWRFYLLVALPSMAMGLQNATLTHFGPLSVRTTHVTGTLAKFTDEAVRYLIWLAERLKARTSRSSAPPPGDSAGQKSLRRASLFLLAWTLYSIGAFLGAYLKGKWQLSALYLPVAILIGVVAMDRIRPLAPARQRF